MDEREPILLAACGAKGVGKTFTSTAQLATYVRPNSSTGKVGRKVLIYDINKEYTKFKTLDPKDIKKYAAQKKVEIRRILPVDENGVALQSDEIVDLLKKIVEDFTGGCLLLEDINRYMTQANQVKEILGLICTNRHRDLDIILHYQSLAALDPRMWQNTTMIRFHFQTDDINRYKNRIPNYELMKIAQCIVNYRYFDCNDKRFNLTVSLLDNFITGDFTVADFVEGCREFLLRNQTIVNKVKGKYGNNKDVAETELIKRYIKMYYRGNMRMS